MKKLLQNKKGFTIIEVVLVLAIAGLIFLIVFLALPQLQESQRDTNRRADVGRIIAGINSYAANNSGSLPASETEVNSDVVGAYVEDFNYTVDDGASDVPATADEDTMFYNVGRTCENTDTSDRAFRVYIGLESGGVYCQEG